MKLISFDISSVSTGYALFENKKLVNYGTIIMSHKIHGARLNYFEESVNSLLKEFIPDSIYIEDIWAGLSVKTFKILSYYHGVIHKNCYSYFEKEPKVMAPSNVRKIIGNAYNIKLQPSKAEKLLTGLDSKHLTFNFITEHFKLNDFEFKTHNDITDAIALGLAANIGAENEGSIQDTGNKPRSRSRRGKESLPEASPKVASRQKPRKQRSRGKV